MDGENIEIPGFLNRKNSKLGVGVVILGGPDERIY